MIRWGCYQRHSWLLLGGEVVPDEEDANAWERLFERARQAGPVLERMNGLIGGGVQSRVCLDIHSGPTAMSQIPDSQHIRPRRRASGKRITVETSANWPLSLFGQDTCCHLGAPHRGDRRTP